MKKEIIDAESEDQPKLKFLSFFKAANSSKKIKIIIAGILFIIILLIFASSFFPSNDNASKANQNTIISSQSYAENTEQRLQNILSGIKGISNVKVFVYVESTEEIVYLKDSETTNNNSSNENIKETTVFNKDGSSSSAIVVVTKYPKIEGILIVASGASDVKLKLKIIDAVSIVLSIAPTNIEVLEGKS